MRRSVLAALLLGLNLSAALAVQPDEVLPDPALEARARAISSELRCLVCQNQSIDGSAAPLARDLRLIVRERLKAGDNDKQVEQFLVARYGDFVLLRPPWKLETMLLWLTPLLVLLGGAAAIVYARHSAPKREPIRPLDASEERRLEALGAERTTGS